MSGVYYLRLVTRDGEYYYVGQTGRAYMQRWREHIRDLRAGQHANAEMQRLYQSGAVIVAGVIANLRKTTQARREEIEQRAIAAMQRRGLRVINIAGVPRSDRGGRGGGRG